MSGAKPKPKAKKRRKRAGDAKKEDKGGSAAERAMVAMRIKDLESKLEAAKVKVDALASENSELRRVNEEIEKTAAANRAAWKILHEEKDSHIQFQTARADQLQQEKARVVAELELKLERLELKTAAESEEAQATIRKLMRKIEATMHFVEVQSHLETELATLQKQRATEKVAFQKKFEEQDYAHLKAQKDLEARYDAKVKHLTAQMKGLSDSLMAETTKRTIVENIRLNKMIEDMSFNNKDLILEKEQMKVELINLRRQKELLTVSEKVLAEKNTNARKVIKRLTERVHQMEQSADHEREVDASIEGELVRLQEEVIVLQTTLGQSEAAHAATQASLDAEVSHRQALQREQDSFLSMLEEAAGFILACLQDVKQQLALERESKELAAGIDEMPPSLTALSPSEREHALEYLFRQLNALQSVHGGLPGFDDRPSDSAATATRTESRGALSSASSRAERPPSDGRLSVSIFRWATPSPPPGAYAAVDSKPGVSVGVQTMSMPPGTLFDQALTGGPGAASASSTYDDAMAYRDAVMGEVRPWGKPAAAMPRTKKGPKMFLKRRSGRS